MVDRDITWHIVLSILTAILALLLLAHIVTSSDFVRTSSGLYLDGDPYCVDENGDGYYEYCEDQDACNVLSSTYWTHNKCFDCYAIDYSRDELITLYDRELFFLALTRWHRRELPSSLERDPGVYDLNQNGYLEFSDLSIFKELYLWQEDSEI